MYLEEALIWKSVASFSDISLSAVSTEEVALPQQESLLLTALILQGMLWRRIRDRKRRVQAKSDASVGLALNGDR